MARVTTCDKCGAVGATGKLSGFINRKHQNSYDEYETREKISYDLCDKCLLELVLIVDQFADAITLEVSEE